MNLRTHISRSNGCRELGMFDESILELEEIDGEEHRHPNKIDKLIMSGIDPKYKKAFRPSDFQGETLFVRKFVVPQGGKVSNMQGLGLNNITDRIEL